MKRIELIKKYIEFFKKHKHKEISNYSLIPKEDPTILFTTAGMHPLVPFLTGQPHPQGKRLVNIQKCIRTNDINEVGDETHHTFFEMLGNWSIGDYWKSDAIKMTFEFYTKILKIPKSKISVTCFKGDNDAKKDTESAKIWKSLGVNKIKFLPKKDNWWGPAGSTGPCGPDTEVFINESEIGNNVFMQYIKDEKGQYKEANQKNVDFGGGVERTLAILNNHTDNYLTEIWQIIINQIEKLSNKKYSKNKKEMRIIADHIKAAVFILNEKILPSNKEQGYVLRRLIRRAIRYKKLLDIKKPLSTLVDQIIKTYPDYISLEQNKKIIVSELDKEEKKFIKSLDKGLNKLKKLTKNKKLSGKDAFLLYQSFGFPLEMIIEESKNQKIKFNPKTFYDEQKKHQVLSKTSSSGKFKSGLADHTEETTKLHTATHLLLAALRSVLKDKKIFQRGSNITKDRLRLDFSFNRKLTQEELKKIEEKVNEIIQKGLIIEKKEMDTTDALKSGALGTFGEKYPKRVFVYSAGNFSKEICSGPHVKNTKVLGKFVIIKEQSSAAGVRRIKAILK